MQKPRSFQGVHATQESIIETSYPTRTRNGFLNCDAGNELQQTDSARAAQSGAVGAENDVVSVPDDPRLLGVIDAWPTLSEDARDAVARLAGLRPDDVDDLTPAKVLA